MALLQILALQVRVDIGIMAIKRYSTLSKSQELEPHHQMQLPHFWRSLAPMHLIQSVSLADKLYYCCGYLKLFAYLVPISNKSQEFLMLRGHKQLSENVKRWIEVRISDSWHRKRKEFSQVWLGNRQLQPKVWGKRGVSQLKHDLNIWAISTWQEATTLVIIT